MTMEDWANKLNVFLQFNKYDLLNNSGKVTAEVAKAFAESDFDRLLKETENNDKS